MRRLFEQGRRLLEAEISRERRPTSSLPHRLEVVLPGGRLEMFGDDPPDIAEGVRISGRRAAVEEVGARDPREVPRAPVGHVWLCEDPRPDGGRLGDIVDPQPGDLLLSETECICRLDGLWCRCRLVPSEGIGAAIRTRRRELAAALKADSGIGRSGAGPSGLRARLLGDAAEEEVEGGRQGAVAAGDDARTLAVDYDGQGERQKSWKQCCREMSEAPFEDWPLEGPRTVLHLAKHMDKHGKSPSAFLERWCRAKRIEDSDRVQHELRTIVDCIELLGCYDQVNLANLAGVEVLARRLQTVFDAYELNPQRPNYEAARYFSGMGTATDAVAPELRSCVAKRARDEAEVEKQRQKARELRAKAPPGTAGKSGS